jgi:FKBP-type peptidyl-prolyl cis-trans isomerase FkpA
MWVFILAGVFPMHAFAEGTPGKPGNGVAIRELPSGVRVQVLRTGSGQSPAASDHVVVHYRGTLLDGTEFDSSYARGKPATFLLRRVIPCWIEALQTMRVGEKSRLTCPARTAYGDRHHPRIPVNSTLIFVVELLEIK